MPKVIAYINKAKVFVEKMVLSDNMEMVNLLWGFPDSSAIRICLKCRRLRRHGFDLGSGRSPGEGHGNPFQ